MDGLTPMVGGVVDNPAGFAPGCTDSLGSRTLQLCNGDEYVFNPDASQSTIALGLGFGF